MPVYPLSHPQPQNSGGRIKQFTSKRVKNHILRMFGQNSKRREDPVSITEWPVQPWTGCLYMSCYMNNIYLWLAKHLFIWFSVTGRRNGFLIEPWRQFHKKNSHYVSSHSRITEGMLLAKVRMACVLSCSVVSNSLWCHGLACQAPLSMGFFRQEYWSGLPFPPPGDLPDPGIEPMSPMSPALTSGFSTTELPRKSLGWSRLWQMEEKWGQCFWGWGLLWPGTLCMLFPLMRSMKSELVLFPWHPMGSWSSRFWVQVQGVHGLQAGLCVGVGRTKEHLR